MGIFQQLFLHPSQSAAAAAMAAFKFGLRSFGYLFAFFVVFALSATEIGLASDQLQMYGNSYDRWPSMMYKHTVGLALFCGLWGLLQSLFHWATSSLVNAILAFTNLSLWLALGATLDVASPFIMGCTDNVPQALAPVRWHLRACKGNGSYRLDRLLRLFH